MKGHGPIDRCQVCEGTDLRSVLFLGYLPPVNRMRSIGSPPDQEPWFPAEMLYCPACHLVQLGYAVDPSILFPPDYPYTSGTTRALRDNFADLYQEASDRLRPSPSDLIIDIGSNDGTLLGNFHRAGHRVLGVEPSLMVRIASGRGIPTLMTFFDRRCAETVRAQYGLAKIVTATNVFAHILDVHEALDNIAAVLEEKGVFISESHYLGDLVETLQYDTIYHEHLRYYSLTALRHLLELHGFRVFFVRRIPSHGGSIRVYASRSREYPVDPSVDGLLREEIAAGLASGSWIDGFRERVVRSKLELYELLTRLGSKRRIYGVGAPSRASTLINFLGLDDGIVECVLEVPESLKLHRYIPGTKIPVVEESRLYRDQPPFALLLSWHIGQELCAALKRRGYRGDFIIPLPRPEVVPNESVPVDGAFEGCPSQNG